MTLSKKKNRLKKFRKGLIFIVGIYLLSWILKGVFIAVYIVPTSSMYPTIQRGDYIIALKFPYRFKTPEFYPLSAAPFPFYSKSGLIQPKIDDIWVFSSPINYELHPSIRMTLVKRLIGLPGDTLYTKENIIIDQIDLISTSTQKHVVPKEGMTVHFDLENITYWERLILRDGSDIQVDTTNKTVVINGIRTASYEFKNDFYFMLGDDKKSSRDSRHWGAVPSELLIGRATFIIWRNTGGFSFYKLSHSNDI